MEYSKYIDHIFRYTADCRFSDEDWGKILGKCREWFSGGKVHRAIRPKADSTYEKFIDWVENGLKYGECVQYGNTCGIMGRNVPLLQEASESDLESHSGVFLAAYLDYDGNLVKQAMEVRDPSRLRPLDAERSRLLKQKMQDAQVTYSVRNNSLVDLYRPEKYFYVAFESGLENDTAVGMYLESDGCKHHFAAFLFKDKLQMDVWIDANYAPLKAASAASIRELHNATSKAGYVFSERLKQFLKAPQKKGVNNAYYYINEFFEVVMDRDNGGAKHTARFNAGNYFADGAEALMVASEIRKMLGKG